MMDNIDELLNRAQKTYDGWNNPPSPELPEGAGIVLELAATIRAQQSEIERLKGEYARGIEDAENTVEFMKGIGVDTTQAEIIRAIHSNHPKQKECE